VYLTREPGGTVIGEKVRKILLDNSNEIDSYTELFLYLADRSEHIVEILKPRLLNGEIVISDRYFDSTIAYQRAGRGISRKEIETIKELGIFRYLEPEITFLLDVDPLISQKRVENPDRIEEENIEFHKAVREAYLKEAEKNPERIIAINAKDTIENIHRIIKGKVLDLIKEVGYE